MKKTILILAILILCGCRTSLKGPISGMVYNTASDPNYKLEIFRKKRLKEINKYLENHPNTSPVIKNNMLNFRVIPGMDKEQVVAVVGEPSYIVPDKDNPTKEIWGWTGDSNTHDMIYYFENGIFFKAERCML
jgi:hypothetical protein